MQWRQSKSWGGVLVGIFLGIFLGISLRLEGQFDLAHITSGPSAYQVLGQEVLVRCVVLVQEDDPKPHKFVQAVVDTYAKRCNQTVFFCASDNLQRQFGDQAQIFTIEGNPSPSSYTFFYRVLSFMHKTKDRRTSKRTWTIFVNEQNFVIPENLGRLARSFPVGQAVVVGRLVRYRSLASLIFPFVGMDGFAMDAGVAMSEEALASLAQDECLPGWTWPVDAGKGLLHCTRKVDVAVLDPTDEEGRRLFEQGGLRQALSGSQTGSSVIFTKGTEGSAACCSDRLVSIGRATHKEIRVIDYVVYHVRVFGW